MIEFPSSSLEEYASAPIPYLHYNITSPNFETFFELTWDDGLQGFEELNRLGLHSPTDHTNEQNFCRKSLCEDETLKGRNEKDEVPSPLLSSSTSVISDSQAKTSYQLVNHKR